MVLAEKADFSKSLLIILPFLEIKHILSGTNLSQKIYKIMNRLVTMKNIIYLNSISSGFVLYLRSSHFLKLAGHGSP